MGDRIEDRISTDGEYAVFRPVGEHTLDEAVEAVNGAIEFCRGRGIGRLLVNILDMTGFGPPSTFQRFEFATAWAETAGGKVAVAMVARPELIDPDKIGVTIARNRGLRAEVFTNESEAIAWLGLL